MKILMLTYEITDLGGNFIRSFSLAKSLARKGHEVTLLSSGEKASLFKTTNKRNGVKIIEVADIFPRSLRHNGISLMHIINRCLYVLKIKFDIVHGFGHRPSVCLPSFFHKILYKKPYIADWADLWGNDGIATRRGRVTKPVVGFLDTNLEKIVYGKLADGVTVICKDLKKRLMELNNHISNKIITVGASIDEIKSISKSKARKLEKIQQNIPIVVFVGNAEYDEKLLANVFIELVKINPKVKMIFAGKRMFVLEHILKRARIYNRLIYKGFVKHNNLASLLSCGDVLLLPYSNLPINRGRFPNKLGDYIAAGRPVVTNPTGDLKDFFNKYKVGLLANENPKKFAQVINKLLINKKLAVKIGQNARKIAEEKMNWDNLSEELTNFYEEVAK